MQDLVTIENRPSVPVTYRGMQIIPFIQSLRIRIPGLQGGLNWERPISVLAVSPDGKEQVLPVQDVTRTVVWSLLGASLISWLLFWMMRRR